MIDLKGKTQEELIDFFVSLGEKPFNGKQVYQWIYYRKENDFSRMTNLTKKLRAELKEKACISEIKLVTRQASEDKNTEKFLYELSDGNIIETVIMRYEKNLGPGRVTICISSQAGCALGCIFCASGCDGLIRNLTVPEIIDQIIVTQKLLSFTEERIANVVIMGIGEPLANYDNLVSALKFILDSHGIGIGHRHVSISTCGLVPQIRKLAGDPSRCKLAVSLHGYNDEIRSKLMPVNKKYHIQELLRACKYYQDMTDTRITFEYVLIKDINDSIEGAAKLAKMISPMHCIVNIIPINPVPHFPYGPPEEKICELFAKEIEKYGIKATLRQERGRKIDGACGQLRLRHKKS